MEEKIINAGCEQCLYRKQAASAKLIQDAAKREAYLQEIKNTLEQRNPSDRSPYIVFQFNQIKQKYGIPLPIFPTEEYNTLLLNMEDEIEKSIEESIDPLRLALLYSRVGNYIDFGAMNTVAQDVLLTLIDEVKKTSLDEDIYHEFLHDCEKGKTFLLLCDNCGEVVLDKLFIRQLKKRYPSLQVFAMVRGGKIFNDVTLEDAEYVGLTKECSVITNGEALGGTLYDRLGTKEKLIFDQADVILSKGQANYESLNGMDFNIYYSFLCKCDLFTTKFNVPKLTGVFTKR